MKKIVGLITLIMSFSISPLAADQALNYNIPNAKAAWVVEGYTYMYPNSETIDDPAWVDPLDGSTPDQIPKYTDKQWVKEKIRRNILKIIRRGHQIKAKDAIEISADDTALESV